MPLVPPIRDPEGVETRHLHEFLDVSGARVLEIGCGDGRLMRRYADSARHTTGIDLDPVRLRKAASEAVPALQAPAAVLKADAVHLPFARETFDHAILGWSL